MGAREIINEKLLSEDESERIQLYKKWEPFLRMEEAGYPKFPTKNSEFINLRLMENWEREQLKENTVTGDLAKYDPMLMSVLRRNQPQLIPFEIFGTQPLTKGPVGLIFCMKSVYHNTTAYPVKGGNDSNTNSRVLFLENATNFSVGGAITGSSGGVGVVRYKEDNIVLVQVTSGTFAKYDSVDNANPYSAPETTITQYYDNEAHYQFLFSSYSRFPNVAAAEVASTNIPEMGFTLEKTTVEAENFKLKAKYSDEMAQDLKAQQGMDADTELTRILGYEVTAEQNRKFINYLNTKAALGGNYAFDYNSTAYGGDADGRWEAEKTFSFYSYINKIANQIALTTHRGRGNFIVASLDVISKLETLRQWKDAPDISGGFQDINIASSCFVGTLGGKFRVFCDRYSLNNYITIGYKGPTEMDAGIFYAPYVPLYVKKGIGEEDGQPRLWFNTRYGIADNPFGAHLYYRKITVNNL